MKRTVFKKLLSRAAIWVLVKLEYPVIPQAQDVPDTDYVMLGEREPYGNTFWLTIESLSLHIAKRTHGASIEVYPLGHEHDTTMITDLWVTYKEGEV